MSDNPESILITSPQCAVCGASYSPFGTPPFCVREDDCPGMAFGVAARPDDYRPDLSAELRRVQAENAALRSAIIDEVCTTRLARNILHAHNRPDKPLSNDKRVECRDMLDGAARRLSDALSTPSPIADAMLAVIEAARAIMPLDIPAHPLDLTTEWRDLHNALSALRAARGER